MDYLSFIKDPEKTVRSLIKKITHSGEVDLDKQLLHEIKSICKSATDELLTVVFKECIKYLHKEHSQVRVATVKLLDYLFQKSHIIRSKLLDDFDVFLELTLCITQRPKIKLKLPPPKRHAALLQELTIKTLNSWHSDFGAGYEKLRYTYRFLREHRLVDFSAFIVHTQEDLIKQRELQEKQERILTRSIENRLVEYRNIKPEVEYLTTQIDSLVDLITTNGFEVATIGDDVNNSVESSFESERQQHGFANLSQSVEIQFDPYIHVQKTKENKDLLEDLRKLKKQLVEVELPKLVEIEKVFTKRSDELVSTIRDLISLKSRAMNIVVKLSELRLFAEEKDKSALTLDTFNSDSEDDFEEVGQKEDVESYIPKSLRVEYGLEAIDPKELEVSTGNISLVDESFEPIPSCSNSQGNDSTQMRLTCNFRMDNGRLCPRQDKIKCPFHGKIIARDHLGIPLDETQRLKEEKAVSSSKVPEWQDPKLLHDIKMATGIDLTMPSKKRKTNLKKEKKLCDTRNCDLTPKQRLMKRLSKLNKS